MNWLRRIEYTNIVGKTFQRGRKGTGVDGAEGEICSGEQTAVFPIE